MKTATIIRHVAFEDLGSLAPIIEEFDYALSYKTVGEPDFLSFDPEAPDILIVLGGPIGVYEDTAYPFLAQEKRLIATRLAKRLPTLGICLGAQLMAAALGARVYPSGFKEIGFSPLQLSDAGKNSPLRHLEGHKVLHWHGDTYDLPDGATHLASTLLVHQQAFALGDTILGLQFHAEVDTRIGFERWLVGHASELATAGSDIVRLRSDAEQHGAALVEASRDLFRPWLERLNP